MNIYLYVYNIYLVKDMQETGHSCCRGGRGLGEWETEEGADLFHWPPFLASLFRAMQIYYLFKKDKLFKEKNLTGLSSSPQAQRHSSPYHN